MSDVKLAPLADRVIVKSAEQDNVTKGGILLPETAQKDAPQFGVVVRVGPGKEDKAMTVKAGDKVVFSTYAGTKVKLEDEEFLFMREEDIMAIVEA